MSNSKLYDKENFTDKRFTIAYSSITDKSGTFFFAKCFLNIKSKLISILLFEEVLKYLICISIYIHMHAYSPLVLEGLF